MNECVNVYHILDMTTRYFLTLFVDLCKNIKVPQSDRLKFWAYNSVIPNECLHVATLR